MKHFDTHLFDVQACRKELNEFKLLLDTIKEPAERKHLLPLFRRHKNLASLVRIYSPEIQQVDRIAQELLLAGDFACDLVVGESRNNAYCLSGQPLKVRSSRVRRTLGRRPLRRVGGLNQSTRKSTNIERAAT